MKLSSDRRDVQLQADEEDGNPCCPTCRGLAAGCFGILPSDGSRRLMMRCQSCGTYYLVEPHDWDRLAATSQCSFSGPS